MQRLFRALNALTDILGISMTVLMTFCAFIQVIFRYFFNNALDWCEEACIYSFMWMCYAGMVIAMRDNAHLRVDAFIVKAPLRIKAILNVVNMLLTLVFCLLSLIFTFRMAMHVFETGQMTIGLDVPLWIFWIVPPVLLGLMGTYAARALFICKASDTDESN